MFRFFEKKLISHIVNTLLVLCLALPQLHPCHCSCAGQYCETEFSCMTVHENSDPHQSPCCKCCCQSTNSTVKDTSEPRDSGEFHNAGSCPWVPFCPCKCSEHAQKTDARAATTSKSNLKLDTCIGSALVLFVTKQELATHDYGTVYTCSYPLSSALQMCVLLSRLTI